MAKTFKYSHLYTTGTTQPTTGQVKTAEIALGLGETKKIWTKDASGNVIDLGAEIAKTAAVAISAVTPSSTKVKEEYALVNSGTSTPLGTTIKIYKDSSLISIELVDEDPTQEPPKQGQFLKYTYIDASGKTESVYVDVSALLVEAEFASGVSANTSGVVHGVVDESGEFLSVGANGFKVDGVTNAIDTAISGLDADVSGNSTHVTVNVVETDGVLTAVNVTEDNIADASALTAEIAARKAVDGQNGDTYSANSNANYISGATSLNDADVKLDAAVKTVEDGVGALSAKTVTEISSTNGSITATSGAATQGDTVKYDIQTDASMIKLSGYTSGDLFSGITSDSSVTAAFQVIENNLYKDGTNIVFSDDAPTGIVTLSAGRF